LVNSIVSIHTLSAITIKERNMNGNVYPDVSKTSRIRWNAIFAGVFLATVAGVLLNMLGLGVGLTALDLDPDTLTNLSIGSAIWWTLSGAVAMFIGGWSTVRLSNITNRTDSILNALTTWSLSTILGLLFIGSTVGVIISGTGNLLSSGLSVATQAASQAAPIAQMAANMPSPMSQVTSQAQELIDQASANIKKSGNSVGQVTQQFNDAISQWLTADNQQDQQQAQQQVVNLLTKYTNMSQTQAQNTVQKWQQNFQAAQQKAQEVTEQAGDVMGGVAIVGFIILLLGGIAAAAGGVMGGRSKRI
jgi:hypothetical protein